MTLTQWSDKTWQSVCCHLLVCRSSFCCYSVERRSTFKNHVSRPCSLFLSRFCCQCNKNWFCVNRPLLKVSCLQIGYKHHQLIALFLCHFQNPFVFHLLHASACVRLMSLVLNLSLFCIFIITGFVTKSTTILFCHYATRHFLKITIIILISRACYKHCGFYARFQLAYVYWIISVYYLWVKKKIYARFSTFLVMQLFIGWHCCAIFWVFPQPVY